METTEKWLLIPGYEGLYEVSDTGRVRSLEKRVTYSDGRTCIRRARILTPKLTVAGYQFQGLYRDGKRQQFTVHRLVLAAFIGPRPSGAVIRHLNGDRLDNRLGNLTYGTQSENARDTVRHGRNPHARKVKCINGHDYDSRNTYHHPGGYRSGCPMSDKRDIATEFASLHPDERTAFVAGATVAYRDVMDAIAAAFRKPEGAQMIAAFDAIRDQYNGLCALVAVEGVIG